MTVVLFWTGAGAQRSPGSRDHQTVFSGQAGRAAAQSGDGCVWTGGESGLTEITMRGNPDLSLYIMFKPVHALVLVPLYTSTVPQFRGKCSFYFTFISYRKRMIRICKLNYQTADKSIELLHRHIDQLILSNVCHRGRFLHLLPLCKRAVIVYKKFIKTKRQCSELSPGSANYWGSPRCLSVRPTTVLFPLTLAALITSFSASARSCFQDKKVLNPLYTSWSAPAAADRNS